MNFKDVCDNAEHIVNDLLNAPSISSTLKLRVNSTIEVLHQALANFQLHEIAISYNGGKDCLVMLILLLAVLNKKVVNDVDHKLDCVYISTEESFLQVTDFIDETSEQYRLNLISIKDSMKNGLQKYLDENKHIKAIIVGIRRNDPYGEDLKYIQPTDHGWPDFIRIHPVLDWHYKEIWDFLLLTKTPYCSLYDEGYTSLGGIHTTIPNPYLANSDGTFKPAYLLEDEDQERSGRVKK